MTSEEKDRLMEKAVKFSNEERLSVEQIRKVLTVLKVQNLSWGKIERFIRAEGYKFTAGQIKYYFEKKTLNETEITAAKEIIHKTNVLDR